MQDYPDGKFLNCLMCGLYIEENSRLSKLAKPPRHVCDGSRERVDKERGVNNITCEYCGRVVQIREFRTWHSGSQVRWYGMSEHYTYEVEEITV